MSFFTVGHSTRSLDELVALLHEHEITLLADVRTIPGSRRMPHFSRASLASALPERGIGYVHMPALGGLRQPRPNSVNLGWRNMSFRGYADYMAQPEFRSGMAELIELGRDAGVAIMCAEAVPWRCHRSLIADALLIRGIAACHILAPGSTQPHRLTPFARADGDRLTYPIQEGNSSIDSRLNG